MQKSKAVLVTLLLTGGGLASLVSLAPAQSAHDQGVLVVRGAQILPITGPPIAQGILVVKGGKIVAIGAAGQLQIPAGATIQDATGKIITFGRDTKDPSTGVVDHVDTVITIVDKDKHFFDVILTPSTTPPFRVLRITYTRVK